MSKWAGRWLFVLFFERHVADLIGKIMNFDTFFKRMRRTNITGTVYYHVT